MQKNTDDDERSRNTLHLIHVVNACVVYVCVVAPGCLPALALRGVRRFALDPEGDDPDGAPDNLHTEKICSYSCVGTDAASFLGYRPDESTKAGLV